MNKSKLFRKATVLAIGACVGKVVGSACSHLIPADAGRATKIAYHVGAAGITIAATKIINDQIEEVADECEAAVEEAKMQIQAAQEAFEEEAGEE